MICLKESYFSCHFLDIYINIYISFQGTIAINRYKFPTLVYTHSRSSPLGIISLIFFPGPLIRTSNFFVLTNLQQCSVIIIMPVRRLHQERVVVVVPSPGPGPGPGPGPTSPLETETR